MAGTLTTKQRWIDRCTSPCFAMLNMALSIGPLQQLLLWLHSSQRKIRKPQGSVTGQQLSL